MSPDANGEWHAWFRLHRATCRYADGADAIAPVLDMWGLAYARVALVPCKVCKPDPL